MSFSGGFNFGANAPSFGGTPTTTATAPANPGFSFGLAGSAAPNTAVSQAGKFNHLFVIPGH